MFQQRYNTAAVKKKSNKILAKNVENWVSLNDGENVQFLDTLLRVCETAAEIAFVSPPFLFWKEKKIRQFERSYLVSFLSPCCFAHRGESIGMRLGATSIRTNGTSSELSAFTSFLLESTFLTSLWVLLKKKKKKKNRRRVYRVGIGWNSE